MAFRMTIGVLLQLAFVLILSAGVAVIAADDGEIEFRGKQANYTCAIFKEVPPTTVDSFTNQCFGHCCTSPDGQRVAWFCLYFPKYKSEWQWEYLCYAILERPEDPYSCSPNATQECGTQAPPGYVPTPPIVPTTAAVTIPMATTKDARTSKFGNVTRAHPPTSPTTTSMSPEPEVPQVTEKDECWADVWFVPFLICVIVAIMLTLLVIAVMIVAWMGRKSREQDKRVVYIIKEVPESRSKRTGRTDKSSRTSKTEGGGGGAGPKTLDAPSGRPGEFENYANLRTQDSAAVSAAAAANVTEDGPTGKHGDRRSSNSVEL
ncbi:hypothetical protein AAVH_05148 [Aphelenchoides avenae]|nr:hypothetical protein AAVH_05148 [Aphelenchus avenae]